MFGFLGIFLTVGLIHEFPREITTSEKAKKWVMEFAFPDGLERPITKDRSKVRTDALLVIKNGKVVLEYYQKGFGPAVPHLTWSVTKSVMNTLIGIAVQSGILYKGTRVEEFYPELEGSHLDVSHLLHWASGIRWNEGYEFNPIHSRVVQMLFSIGRSDMAAFVASQGMSMAPGSLHRYSSGDSVLLAGVLRKALGEELYIDFAKRELFQPLQMRNSTFEKDLAGTYIGSSFLYASPEDMARWGLMHLQNGIWQNRRFLSEKWIEWSLQIPPSFKDAKVHSDANWIYPAAHFWVNKADPNSGMPRVWKKVPEDFYMAKGHWGQAVAMIPSENMVVVRFADDRVEGVFDWNEFFGTLIEVLK